MRLKDMEIITFRQMFLLKVEKKAGELKFHASYSFESRLLTDWYVKMITNKALNAFTVLYTLSKCAVIVSGKAFTSRRACRPRQRFFYEWKFLKIFPLRHC